MPVSAFAFLLALGWLAPAAAQTTLPASVGWETTERADTRPSQIPLTPERIERFLSSVPPMLAFARQIDLTGERPPDNDLSLLFAALLRDPAHEAQAEALVSQFGFSTYGDWARTSHTISLVLAGADITGSLDLASHEKGALRDIERNAALSADEKVRALDELKRQFSALAEFEPLPGNREIAAPYIEDLRAAIGR